MLRSAANKQRTYVLTRSLRSSQRLSTRDSQLPQSENGFTVRPRASCAGYFLGLRVRGAAINGILAAPLMAAMMLIVRNPVQWVG
jgi:hypothetical protein